MKAGRVKSIVLLVIWRNGWLKKRFFKVLSKGRRVVALHFFTAMAVNKIRMRALVLFIAGNAKSFNKHFPQLFENSVKQTNKLFDTFKQKVF